jgi:DNA polymerase epsilon subunit 1
MSSAVQHGGSWKKDWAPRQSATERNAETDRLDAVFGYDKLEHGSAASKEGWMTNFRAINLEDEETGATRGAVEYYFLAPDGTGFKAVETAQPYFYLSVRAGFEREVDT